MKDITGTKLELRRLIPPFALTSATGETISPWDYKEKKALLILFLDPTNSMHLAALTDLSRRYHDVADIDAEVLAIASGPIDLVRACVEGFRPPFHVLADTNGRVRSDYGASGLTVFAADRFGDLLTATEVGENVDSAIENAITAIELSELECPECGAPTWPEA